MIGEKFWATGISLKFHSQALVWGATVEFLDDGFCQNASTEGHIRSRYFAEIETVIDNVKRDAEKLGIEWRDKNLYVEKDGEGVILPENWRAIVAQQAERIGFKSIYGGSDNDHRP